MSTTADFLPTEIHEESPSSAWSNPANIESETSAVTKVNGSGTIANLGLRVFNIGSVIPEGAKIESVKVVYKVRAVTHEGNPITGVEVQSGGVSVTNALFGAAWHEIEGGAVPSVLTEIVVDLSAWAPGWNVSKLEDAASIAVGVRCRNNGGKTTEFEYDYVCLRITYTEREPGATFLAHEDLMGAANPEAEWGNPTLGCVSAARFSLVEEHYDTRCKGDGSASIAKGRKVLMKVGDRAPGDSTEVERCEMGQNERRHGSVGNEGTFMLFQPGSHHKTYFSVYLDSTFPISTTQFNTIMQMKQTQPYSNSEYSSPILELEARQNQFQLISQPGQEAEPLWTCAATTGRVVRFCIDAVYHGLEEGGLVKIQVDDRSGSPTTFIPQHESAFIQHQTLTKATEAGSGLALNQLIPSHLRMGIYRKSAVAVETFTIVSNVQSYIILPSGPVEVTLPTSLSFYQHNTNLELGG